MKEEIKSNKHLYILFGVPAFVFGSLFFLICFPIFVLTTVCSFAVTGSRLLFTIIKGDDTKEVCTEKPIT